MDLLIDIVLDAAKDTLALVPFLLVTYMALEALEHAAGERVNSLVRRAGAAGPAVGALLGVVPQCGFSAMGATLYAGRVITLGTLVAVLLSTSDEMLPMLLAERVEPSLLLSILAAKVLIALISGVVLDALVRVLRHNERLHAVLRAGILGAPLPWSDAPTKDVIDQIAEAGEGAEHIHRLCEQDHCGCDDDEDEHVVEGGAHAHGAHERGYSLDAHVALVSILRSAISHTLQVSLFIFLVTLALVTVLTVVGEDALAGFLASNQALALVGSALVGLIPNCSASVVITQLYLEGVLGFGPLMAGLLVSAGVGYLVLFRTNRHTRENAVIVALLFVIAVFWGFVLSLVWA